jgi:molybdopterin molybdotransferase
MISTLEASQLIEKHLPRWAMGTHAIVADRDYPPFHRVMMDGIAVKYEEFERGVRSFNISGVCAAGESAKKLHEGCLEVMTGAPLPIGADLVIQYEHLRIENGMAQVIVEQIRKPHDSVHLEGSDCKKGTVVLAAGQSWNGPHVGIAASMGESFTPKFPKIMIISTGDELVETNPLPHQIRRSNAYALKKSLEMNGFLDVTLDHLMDDPREVSEHYIKHAFDFDMLIYSGGVSKGKFDYLPHVWADLGVTKHFHEVSQKPGKPLWFGTDDMRKTTVVGLPGNPVSSLICLHRYFIPSRKLTVKLNQQPLVKGSLTHFIPVKIDSKDAMLLAHPLKIKNSGEFTALAGSDGFIEYNGEASSYSFYSWRSF